VDCCLHQDAAQQQLQQQQQCRPQPCHWQQQAQARRLPLLLLLALQPPRCLLSLCRLLPEPLAGQLRFCRTPLVQRLVLLPKQAGLTARLPGRTASHCHHQPAQVQLRRLLQREQVRLTAPSQLLLLPLVRT
jgi:hypothetical protein